MSRELRRKALAASPLDAVYEQYASSLNRYLIRRVHRQDVEDLTQEIFELFVRRKTQAEVIRNPLAYLFRIAFHVVGTTLADNRRNPVTCDLQRSPAASVENAGSSSEDAEELVALTELRTILESLPASYLTALMLVDGHGMTYKEAARVSGFTPSTIATYVMHARAALKVALDGRIPAKDAKQ